MASDAAADPSPAPETPVSGSDFLSSASDADYKKWRETGELPGDANPKAEEATPPDSPSPKVEEQPASTDVPPKTASEPVKKSKAQGAEERVQELLAERAAERQRAERAERELAEFRQQKAEPAKPKEAPAPKVETFPGYVDWLEKNEGKSYEDYLDSRSAFSSEQAFKKLQAEDTSRREQESRQSTVQGRFAAHNSRLAEAIKAEPEFLSKLSPEMHGLMPLDSLGPNDTATVLNYIGQEVLLSDKGPQLMRYLSDHPEEFAALKQVTTVDGVIRRIGYLTARLDSPPPAPKGRTVTGAPPPPSSPVGGKAGTDPANPVEAAAAAGDFRAYLSAKNAEEMVARK